MTENTETQECRITLRMPMALRRAVGEEAKRSSRSLNGQIVFTLKKEMEAIAPNE